jgi:tRNA threonylcarbamoyladenosine biosynthesis protein TsaB
MAREWVLAIEISNPSSGPRGAVRGVVAGPSVALGRPVSMGGMPMVEAADQEPVRGDDRHDDDLMPAIDRLCTRAGVSPGDLRRVAVSIGPGGYTSLRIAVATAKMLAEATGAEVVAVPTALAAAWMIEIRPPAVVCLASKGETAHATLLPPDRGDAWWGSRDSWSGLLAPAAIATMDERVTKGKAWIAAAAPIGVIGAGELRAIRPTLVIADRFLPEAMRREAENVGATVVEPVLSANAVLRLSGDFPAIDPLRLAPLYPREPEAVTQWRKRHGGG